MKSTFLIQIEHDKLLPKEHTTVFENRIHDYLKAKGGDVEVKVTNAIPEGPFLLYKSSQGAGMEDLCVAQSAGNGT